MAKSKFEYKVVTSQRASGLTDKINELVQNGWEVDKGSYSVVESMRTQIHGGMTTRIESEYSVLMTKPIVEYVGSNKIG